MKVLVLILTSVCIWVCAGSLLEQPIAPRPRARHRARAQRAAAKNNTLQFVLFSPRTTSESQYCNFGISNESIELSYRNVPDTNGESWIPLATLPLGGKPVVVWVSVSFLWRYGTCSSCQQYLLECMNACVCYRSLA